MSTVSEKIAGLAPGDKFVLFEFFPPKTDSGFRNLLARLTRMLALNPLFVTVTWGAGGSTSEKLLELASTCEKLLNLTTILHLTCTNTNKEVIDQALQKAKENGIRNILALRGDPPRTQEYWTPNCEFSYAVDLVKYIKETHGDYFCVGVAGYPEGHLDSTTDREQDPRRDLPFLREKVAAGADFIITQLFFDTDKFLSYEKLLQSDPLLSKVTLIPGLMPITTYLVFLRATKLSSASVPEDIDSKLRNADGNDDLVKQIGVDIMVDMVAKIDQETQGRVKGYHFYSLNLEKAIASIIEKSEILSPILDQQQEDLDTDVFEEDNDIVGTEASAKSKNGTFFIQPPAAKLAKRRKSSIVNSNEPTDSAISGFTARKPTSSEKKTLVTISTGKGVLGKDAIWDDFPNGRFGNSDSPAYGEIDGYGPTLKLSTPAEVIAKWGEPQNVKDITKVFVNYLTGKIDILPWVGTLLSPETALIQEELLELNNKGWFSLASQPAVDGASSSDKIFGWGPRGGKVYQKPFVELFIPKKDWEQVLKPRLQPLLDSMIITYYIGDNKSNVQTNLGGSNTSHNTKNALTWGVFPLREVLQPTLVDLDSFKAWNEEAFILWVEWAKSYKKDSPSYELLQSVNDDYYLVSLIYHDYKNEFGLWNLLLDQ